MKKNTKKTIKVLSGLALVSTVAVATNNTVDAKTYKPEVRYDNGKYFVKTSDPSAKGKILQFSINQNSNEYPYFIYDIIHDYKNQEVEIKKDDVESTTNIKLNDERLISIQDHEKPFPDGEVTGKVEYEKQLKDFYKETASGAVSIKDALGGKQGAPAKGKVENPQPKSEPKEEPKASLEIPKSEPKASPKTPKSESKEEPKASPETTPKSESQEGSKTSTENPKTVSQQELDAKNGKKSKMDADLTIGEKVKEKQENLSSIFGQNSELNKKDENAKSSDRVYNKKSDGILADTGLRTSSYALLASIVGLVGVITLRKKNR